MGMAGKRRISTLISLAAACGLAPWALAAQPPEVSVRSCEHPPTMDGDLSDSCWKQAATLSGFHIFQAEGRRSDQTKALATFDSRWLYIGIECANPFQWGGMQILVEI